MPELPEVEIARRNIARWAGDHELTLRLVDRAVARPRLSTHVAHADPAIADALDGLHGAPQLRRHGKRLQLTLGDHHVLVHFGMTGRWIRAPEAPPTARAALHGPGDPIWFCDTRRFGALTPVDDDGLRAGLGPDALAELSEPAVAAALAAVRSPVKVALMDQTKLAGLGNIHAAEALHRAGLHPARPAYTVVDPAPLTRAIRDQLHYALAVSEADDVAYLSDGAHVENPFAVYGRRGQLCGRCSTTIERDVHAGRSTFWCPTCQPVFNLGDRRAVVG